MELDEKTHWNRKYSEGSHTSLEPDPLLVGAYNEFLAARPPGSALDVAGGVGRHALWLAEHGWKVKLIDISDAGIDLARRNADKVNHGPHSSSATPQGAINTELLDLNSASDLGSQQYDLVLVFFYLQRELFPALIAALKPDGLLIYKTYSTAHQATPAREACAGDLGGPSNPMFLLQPNELLRAFQSLRILHYHETLHHETLRGKGVTELVARK